MRLAVILLGGAVVFGLLWALSPVTGIDAYIGTVKSTVSIATVPIFGRSNPAPDQAEWRKRIEREAKKRRIEPVNARLDRVWKAIPGYNGLEVDVERTLKVVQDRKLKPGSPIPFVYREISPKVRLEHLEPQPIYKGNPNKPMVALMINVAWGDEFLPKMLDVLNKENVRATFFFDGSWLSKHMDTARTIGSYGHELSNHAYSHKDMSKLSAKAAAEEIAKTEKLLIEGLGVRNTLFAPPSGDYDAETVRIAAGMKLKTVLWTLDTLDWKKPAPQTIVRKIYTRVEPGSMILMHPTYSSSAALEQMIREIKRKGLALGTVSQLLAPDRVPPVVPQPKPQEGHDNR